MNKINLSEATVVNISYDLSSEAAIAINFQPSQGSPELNLVEAVGPESGDTNFKVTTNGKLKVIGTFKSTAAKVNFSITVDSNVESRNWLGKLFSTPDLQDMPTRANPKTKDFLLEFEFVV